jgi:hypothetical protein
VSAGVAEGRENVISETELFKFAEQSLYFKKYKKWTHPSQLLTRLNCATVAMLNSHSNRPAATAFRNGHEINFNKKTVGVKRE